MRATKHNLTALGILGNLKEYLKGKVDRCHSEGDQAPSDSNRITWISVRIPIDVPGDP